MDKLSKINRLIRFDIITSTTQAGSGHPSSCLSAVELMSTLFFDGFFKFNFKSPHDIFNDRVIFSKGHAAPLLYALYHAAGTVSYEEILTLRKFGSILEGHPTPRFPYVDVATGSLGQGLSMGLGMALGIRLMINYERIKMKREPKVWVLLGDSELAEGQNWEAIQSASFHKLNNLVGILDVNRLGQTDETMLAWDIDTYQKRIASFGWDTIIIENCHNIESIRKALQVVDSPRTTSEQKPIMIIAKTVKGKGVSFLEDKNGWHGKTVPKDMLQKALDELGKVDLKVKRKIKPPQFEISIRQLADKSQIQNQKLEKILDKLQPSTTDYRPSTTYSTREAFGDALITLGKSNKKIVVFDAEMANSTFENKFQTLFPERFFEMYIEEQNMISASVGISKMGYIPFVSTFASFLTRGFDQIRMAQYSNANIKIIGSHAGVFIGADGPSQMGLEDISMMRSILNSVVLCPSDALSTYTLTQKMANIPGIVYMRTLREKTPVIYDSNEKFVIGGSKIHFGKNKSKINTLIITSGVTVHEALKAQTQLSKEGIYMTVLDCYSIKPIDKKTINLLVQQANNIIVVEDHYPTGGLGEAVMQALLANLKFQISNFKFAHLCVRQTPCSGTPQELLHYEEIDSEAIFKAVKKTNFY